MADADDERIVTAFISQFCNNGADGILVACSTEASDRMLQESGSVDDAWRVFISLILQRYEPS